MAVMFNSVFLLFMLITSCKAQQCSTAVLERALIPYDSCLTSIMELLFHQRGNQPDLQSFLQQICSTVVQTSLRTCHNTLDQTVNSCLSYNQRGLLDVLKASSWSGIGFVCQNSARLLTEFREQGRGYECLQRADKGQNQCLRQNPILSMYITSYSGEFCSVTQPSGLECLNQAFRMARCSEMALNFLNGYYRSLTQVTPCLLTNTNNAFNSKINVITLLTLCISLYLL